MEFPRVYFTPTQRESPSIHEYYNTDIVLCQQWKKQKLIKENNLNCKIMVGGAVLTPEYAEKIGADFYSKDAKQSVDIAKQVIG